MKILLVTLMTVLMTTMAQAQTAVCSATCLVSETSYEVSGDKFTVTAVEESKAKAILNISQQCQELARKEQELHRSSVISGQLITSFSGSKGSGMGAEGRYVTYDFNVAAACVE